MLNINRLIGEKSDTGFLDYEFRAYFLKKARYFWGSEKE